MALGGSGTYKLSSTQGSTPDIQREEPRQWLVCYTAVDEVVELTVTDTTHTSLSDSKSFTIETIPALAITITSLGASITDISPLDFVLLDFAVADGADPAQQCYRWESHDPSSGETAVFSDVDRQLNHRVTRMSHEVQLVVLDDTCSTEIGTSNNITITMARYPDWMMAYSRSGPTPQIIFSLDILNAQAHAVKVWQWSGTDWQNVTYQNAEFIVVSDDDPAVDLHSAAVTSGYPYIELDRDVHFGPLPTQPGSYNYTLYFRAQKDGQWGPAELPVTLVL